MLDYFKVRVNEVSMFLLLPFFDVVTASISLLYTQLCNLYYQIEITSERCNTLNQIIYCPFFCPGI